MNKLLLVGSTIGLLNLDFDLEKRICGFNSKIRPDVGLGKSETCIHKGFLLCKSHKIRQKTVTRLSFGDQDLFATRVK